MTLRDHLEDFLSYLRDIKNYSSHTIVGYQTDLIQFLEYIIDQFDLQLHEINHTHVRSWIVTLLESGIGAKSINRKISSLRAFFKFLRRKEIVSSNPMAKVIAPKIAKRLPDYVDQEKIAEILDDKSLASTTFYSAREHIIISLLYHTGIRRSELIGLELSDIDLLGKSIKVIGKGNKERIIPLNDQILEELEGYIQLRNSSYGVECKYLIVSNKGQKAYPKLIYNIVSNVLKKYNASLKTSPHILRHTFATHLTAGGAELNAVKELLGHSSLAATQVYTHNSIERLKEVYDKSHPKSKHN